MNRRLLPLLAALAPLPVLAQASYSADELATVQFGERVVYDAQSVRTLGELTRFEVMITARPPSERTPGSAAERKVRYAARCTAGELAIAGVTLYDDSGRMLKTIVVPPGAGDYVKPAAGSNEAQWMSRAC